MSVRKMFWPLMALALFVFAATQARAQDRCQGTLCDFYYGNKPAAAQQPQAAAPQAAAPQAAPDPNRPPGGYLMDMFSGGSSTAAAPGAPAPQDRRCEGTLCDFYYGEATPAEKSWPAAPPPQAAPLPAPVRAATGRVGATNRADASGPDLERESRASFVERPQPTLCAATKADPWKCYR